MFELMRNLLRTPLQTRAKQFQARELNEHFVDVPVRWGRALSYPVYNALPFATVSVLFVNASQLQSGRTPRQTIPRVSKLRDLYISANWAGSVRLSAM